MFKKASLRFFAGMLFGSVAGVFLGIGFAVAATSQGPELEEIEKMDDLLRHVIWGSFFGIAFGGAVGLARKPLVTALFCVATAVAAMFAAVALLGPDRDEALGRMAIGAGAMAAAGLIVEAVSRFAKPRSV